MRVKRERDMRQTRGGLIRRTALVGALMAALAGGLASCGGSAATSKLHIAMVLGLDTNSSYQSAFCGAKAAAKKAGNVDVTFDGVATSDASAEVPLLDSALALKPNGMIVVPSQPAGMQGALQRVVNQGVKLITADIQPSKPIGMTFIGPNNFRGGALAAQFLAAKMDHKGLVFIDSYLPGTSPENRVVGFENYMKANDPAIQELPVQFSNAEPTLAAQQTAAALAAHPDITGLFGQNELTAIGMATAVREAGLQGKIPFVAYDADVNEVRLLKNGTFGALVSQGFYYEGYTGVQILTKVLRRQESASHVASTTATQLKVLTRANVGDALSKAFIYTGC